MLNDPKIRLTISDADTSECGKRIIDSGGSPTYFSASMAGGSFVNSEMFQFTINNDNTATLQVGQSDSSEFVGAHTIDVF